MVCQYRYAKSAPRSGSRDVNGRFSPRRISYQVDTAYHSRGAFSDDCRATSTRHTVSS